MHQTYWHQPAPSMTPPPPYTKPFLSDSILRRHTHPTHARAGTQPSLLATRCMPGPMHTISSQLGGQSSGIIYTLGHNIRNPANQMETAISNSAHDDDHNDNRIQKLSILLLPMTTCAANDNMCNVAYTQVMVSKKKKKN